MTYCFQKRLDDYRLSIGTLFVLLSSSPITSFGQVINITTGIETSRVVDGQNISDGKPAISLTADLSFDNGSFAGADCHKSESIMLSDGIDASCNYYLGYFGTLNSRTNNSNTNNSTAFNNEQGVSLILSRSEYAPITVGEWDYTTLALSWHPSPSLKTTLSRVDNWFGRGYGATGLNASYHYALNDHWSASVEGQYFNFEESAPTNSTTYSRFGLRFERGQWAGELNLHITDSERLSQLTPFESHQSLLSASIRYRVY